MAWGRVMSVQFIPLSGATVTVTDHHMTATIERSITRTPNKLNLDMYNLGQTAIQVATQPKTQIIVNAGYADEGGALIAFSGTLSHATDTVDGMDRVLHVEALDGIRNLNAKNMAASYAANTPASTILNDLLGRIGFPVVGGTPQLSGSYAGGWTYVGKVQNALKTVLGRFGYSYCIQNEQLYIFQDNLKPPAQQMVLGYDSGLLSLKRNEEQIAQTARGKMVPGAKAKYKFNSLFFPQLIPGTQVNWTARDYAGPGKIISTSATLSNYENDWNVEGLMEAG
jgi:hypothetical protein